MLTINKKNTVKKPFMKSMKAGVVAVTLGAITMVTPAQSQQGMEELKAVLQGQIKLMKPELQKKVKGLSKETKMSLMAILSMHNRYSEKASMRQVMLEVLADYQTMAMGVMTGSSEMAADAARRLANHRIPVGGLLPYLGMDNIDDDRLAVLGSFNDSVEGNSLKLAEAADKDDMATASSLIGAISTGCVGCHTAFRPGVIGTSDLLR